LPIFYQHNRSIDDTTGYDIEDTTGYASHTFLVATVVPNPIQLLLADGRQRDKRTDRQTDRQTYRQKDRHMDRKTYGERYGKRDRHEQTSSEYTTYGRM
jgi:hypothetical protein